MSPLNNNVLSTSWKSDEGIFSKGPHTRISWVQCVGLFHNFLPWDSGTHYRNELHHTHHQFPTATSVMCMLGIHLITGIQLWSFKRKVYINGISLEVKEWPSNPVVLNIICHHTLLSSNTMRRNSTEKKKRRSNPTDVGLAVALLMVQTRTPARSASFPCSSSPSPHTKQTLNSS